MWYVTVQHTHFMQVNGYSNGNSNCCWWSYWHSISLSRLTNRSGLLRHKQASKIYNTNEKHVRYWQCSASGLVGAYLLLSMVLVIHQILWFLRETVGVPLERSPRVIAQNIPWLATSMAICSLTYVIRIFVMEQQQKYTLFKDLHRTIACDSKNMATVHHFLSKTRMNNGETSPADRPMVSS